MLVLFAALAASTIHAAKPAPEIASPEWNAVDVKPALAQFYAQQFAEALRRAGVRVRTAQDIRTVLDLERQKELMGCSVDSCMTELAAALGCDGTLSVNVARFTDGSFRGLAKVLSSKDGHVLASVRLDASSERALVDALDGASTALAAELMAPPGQPREEPVAAAKATPGSATGRTWWWLVPAGLTVGLGATGGALLGLASAQVTALRSSRTLLDAQNAASSGATYQSAGWGLVAGAGVSLLATVACALFFDAPAVHPSVALWPDHRLTLGVGGAWP